MFGATYNEQYLVTIPHQSPAELYVLDRGEYELIQCEQESAGLVELDWNLHDLNSYILSESIEDLLAQVAIRTNPHQSHRVLALVESAVNDFYVSYASKHKRLPALNIRGDAARMFSSAMSAAARYVVELGLIPPTKTAI